MPNIIEQQDLLKGLPDERLSMLMQNPSGDIPPFLVAAEAQRRQSIREQFSGGPQESVVDTLTKQLAGSVPQNIQAPAQQAPQMPPPQMPEQPPEMAGVGALEQGMRRGGMVRRFADGGVISPTVESLAGSIAGMTKEEYLAEQARKKLEGLGPGKARYLLENPTTPKTEAEIAEEEFRAVTEGPFSGLYSPSSVYEAAAALTESKQPKAEPSRYGMTDEERMMMQTAPRTAQEPVAPRDPSVGTEPTSTANKIKSMSREEVESAYREIFGTSSEDTAYMKEQLEKLYADEPSGWERAQKWFAASQAAMQPGQSNWQAAINALATLGGGFADERAAERTSQRDLAEALLKLEMVDRQERRQAEQNLAKSMLEYDIGERDAAAAAAKSEQDYLRDLAKIKLQSDLAGKREIEKEKTFSPVDAVRSYDQEIKYLQEQLDSFAITPEARERITKRIDSLLREKAVILKNSGYGGSSVPTMDDIRRAAAGQ